MRKKIERTLLLIGVGSLSLFLTDRLGRLNQDDRHKQRIMAGNGAAERAPRPGDILLFYRPGVFADVVIQSVTGSRVYHTALFMEASEDGTIVLEALTSGVQISNLRQTRREADYVVVPAPQDKGEEALAWARTKLGSLYDYKDGLAIGLEHVFEHIHVNFTLPGRYTCSELIARAYEEVGVKLVPNKRPYQVSPGDIAASASAYLNAPQQRV